MKKIVSIILTLMFVLSLTACNSGNKNIVEASADDSLKLSGIQNEAIKTLVGDGRLNPQIENDLPTTLGLLRDISHKAKYANTVYEELPASVRNISKYILGDILKSSASIIAHTGSYTFVKVDEIFDGGKILIVLDNSNRVYRALMFGDGEKTYRMYKGEYNDFSNEFFYKNKKYVELSCPCFVVTEDTNETLMCSYTFPIGENESVDVLHDENGEMLYCCDQSEHNTEYFDKYFNKITAEESERLEEKLKERINKKHGIELPN